MCLMKKESVENEPEPALLSEGLKVALESLRGDRGL